MNLDEVRRGATKLALESYQKINGNRSYALTPETTMMLSAIAQAVAERRKNERLEGSPYGDPFKDTAALFEKLDAAGCNLIQKRPADAEKLPEVWRNPVTGDPLPPPQGPDERGILAKHDPELLKWYDDMAKAPYKTTMEHRERETQRSALAAIPYGESEHKGNPFRGTNESAKAAFLKRDPELAKFYEQEVKPAQVPLFGANRNLTILGKLARDPGTNATIKVAGEIYKTWREHDRNLAEQQVAEAQAQLKKLETEAAGAALPTP